MQIRKWGAVEWVGIDKHSIQPENIFTRVQKFRVKQQK